MFKRMIHILLMSTLFVSAIVQANSFPQFSLDGMRKITDQIWESETGINAVERGRQAVASAHGNQHQQNYSHVLSVVVTRVLDGDTVVVQIQNPPQGFNRSERIRLADIDAPESDQAWGRESTRALQAVIENKQITLAFNDRDRYGRIIGTLYDQNNVNMNYWMVSEGHAWHYKQYSNSRVLAGLETQAKARRLGLWSQPNPVEPWVFRRK